MGTFPPEKIAETLSAQGFGYFRRSKFGLTDPRYLGVAYSLRSLLGFGAGAISPWVFGLMLDVGRAGELPAHVAWGLAWSTLGLGGLLGPVVIWRLRRMPEAAKLANGKR